MGNLALAGLRALEDYIALHVITCLVPAFLLAGAMVTFINRSAVLQFLGERVSRWRTYPLAALIQFFSSFLFLHGNSRCQRALLCWCWGRGGVHYPLGRPGV